MASSGFLPSSLTLYSTFVPLRNDLQGLQENKTRCPELELPNLWGVNSKTRITMGQRCDTVCVFISFVVLKGADISVWASSGWEGPVRILTGGVTAQSKGDIMLQNDTAKNWLQHIAGNKKKKKKTRIGIRHIKDKTRFVFNDNKW